MFDFCCILHAEGGDDLLRLLLFWSLFLPLGRRFSLDSVRQALKTPPAVHGGVAISRSIVSLATVGLFIQITVMYVCNGITKTDSSWDDVRIINGGTMSHNVKRPPERIKILTWIVYR